MLLSSYYIPTTREEPSDVVVISHKLMVRAGMIRQVANGIYNILPLGHRVFQKISKLISEECDKFGCMQFLMPSIQPAELWQKSGRYDSYGKEMLRIKDRNNRDMLFGPTHEEVVTDMLTKDNISYKNLPINLYQIQWKFRDEIRPRYGMMRCREFSMFDAYSFDIDEESAKKTYEMYYEIYLNIFCKLNLQVIPVKANTGAIGGNLSHEFHVLANSGESKIYYEQKLQELLSKGGKIKTSEIEKLYARADEQHEEEECKSKNIIIKERYGIEVGHIFYFGTKYSEKMGLRINNKTGGQFAPHMGSYGIGVTRLMASLIEASHDENGIIWDPKISPFMFILINLDPKDDATSDTCDKIYKIMSEKNIEVLYDDTINSFGEKRSFADLIGIPYQISIGKRSIQSNSCEIKKRKNNTTKTLTIASLNDIILYNRDMVSEFEKLFNLS